MYNRELIFVLSSFISSRNGIADKNLLSQQVQNEFHLTKERSVFYCSEFAIRFCTASSKSFSNTVLSLSSLRKYDSRPFIVCVVTKEKNHLLLANTSFLRKISHSSQELRINNIKGSFNGSDIMRTFEDIENSPENFEFLFNIHENFSFDENLARLVEATNNISPKGTRFFPTAAQKDCLMASIARSVSFFSSQEFSILENDLSNRVRSVEREIAIAAFIDNVNLRGRIIEHLVTAGDNLKGTLIDCLRERKPLPKIFTEDKLGDYSREFNHYVTETDIKTKILFLSSNPKGYNIDKLLSFLSTEKSVYLVYIIAIDENKHIQTRLCSLYHRQLLDGTRIIHHWAGRNSRGVTQYLGTCLEEIVANFDPTIDEKSAQQFLLKCLSD